MDVIILTVLISGNCQIMGLLTQQQKDAITAALKERGAVKFCARCGNNNFGLVDGISMVPLGQGTAPGGQSLPVAMVVCSQCGAVYAHALGVLGLFKDFNIS